MKNITSLPIGIYKSQKKFLEAISGVITVPVSVKVVDITSDIMHKGKENERPWAKLTVVDTVLYEKFESIGQEEYCPSFKVNIKGYLGEDLSQLQDREISFESYELAFVTDKYKQPIGLALVLELNNITIN